MFGDEANIFLGGSIEEVGMGLVLGKPAGVMAPRDILVRFTRDCSDAPILSIRVPRDSIDLLDVISIGG